MGTSNYADTNTTDIFTIGGEELEYEDTRHNVDTCLEPLNKLPEYRYSFDDTLNVTDFRSYPARSIGTVDTWIAVDNLADNVTISLIAKTVAGYYEGSTLDYDIYFETNGFSTDNITDLIDGIFEYPMDYLSKEIHEYVYADDIDDKESKHRENTVMKGIGREQLKSLISNRLNELIKKVEDVYSQFSTRISIVAQFGNGETIYAECDPDEVA